MHYTYSVQAFRSNMSTYRALLELVEKITNALDNKKYAIGVFVDQKKAFDTVDHDIFSKNYISMVCAVLHVNG